MNDPYIFALVWFGSLCAWFAAFFNRNHGHELKGLFAILLISVCVICSGCSATVRPQPVIAHEASFDGGTQNSGILLAVPGGFYITAGRQANYNALVEIYGDQFNPPLKRNAGITESGGNIFIDDQHDIDHKMMQAWKRSGTHQPKSAIQKAVGL